MTSVISKKQKKLLSILSREEFIADSFYLTGGTALAEFYLQHRLSEDLDFFSEREFDPMGISSLFQKVKKAEGIHKVTYEQSFNRNLFFLELEGETIKTEFTFFPFKRIESKKKYGRLQIDGLIDIAVNKVFTIFQKPRSRDFVDLYCILDKENTWTLDSLIRKAQIKFDAYIDPLQLGSQFVKVETLKDYPRMLISLDEKTWQAFFMKEAKRLAKLRIE